MNFDMRSFCGNCGRYRRTMPFGSNDSFWDKEPCGKCGYDGRNRYVIAKKKFLGPWIDREDNEVG